MPVRLIHGDALEELRKLPKKSVDCIVTSPPYWSVCDYGYAEQLGLEASLEEHLDAMASIFRELRRVLRLRGTLFVNYGDAYNTCSGGVGPKSLKAFERKRRRQPSLVTGFGKKSRTHKRKDLLGMPWHLVERLRRERWYFRADIVWRKPVSLERKSLDRPRRCHEWVFFLTRSPFYFWSGDCESVWDITPASVPGHPAPFPLELARRCMDHGCPEGGIVLDPFAGSGTVGLAADQSGRSAILIEKKAAYTRLAERRIREDCPLFAQVETS